MGGLRVDIRTDPKGKMCEVLNWINLAQSPVTASCEDSNSPSSSINGGKFLD
jgi:hypothetical protein